MPKVKAISSTLPATGKLVKFDYRRPGGSLSATFGSAFEAVALIEAGLPFSAIKRFMATSGFTQERVKQITRISEGSFNRRKRSKRLSPDESERLMRLGRMFELATALYGGDQQGAHEWLETPIPALGNRKPLELARTEPGAREVEDLIGRIEHGVVS